MVRAEGWGVIRYLPNTAFLLPGPGPSPSTSVLPSLACKLWVWLLSQHIVGPNKGGFAVSASLPLP